MTLSVVLAFDLLAADAAFEDSPFVNVIFVVRQIGRRIELLRTNHTINDLRRLWIFREFGDKLGVFANQTLMDRKNFNGF